MNTTILSLSDKVEAEFYDPETRNRLPKLTCILGCGDLPYHYLEQVSTLLNTRLFFVHGNHDPLLEYGENQVRSQPLGAINLHGNVVRHKGLLLAGVQGSIRYNPRDVYQYTQKEMWHTVLRLVPGLLWNRLSRGRYLDILVTHAPPLGIHEGTDFPHSGIAAFRWLLKTFTPKLHLHGHIHVYDAATPVDTRFGATRVINTYGHRITSLP
ncbi:MAG: hypothetical protein CSA21_03335 [Deltaproteobacteria bacterium]|nr:MAG: hypothetical protein CSA21_03335 [Deltaproteobacteria bacterium]